MESTCMEKVVIITDSNSGITQAQGKEYGIYVLPMPFYIDGELYLLTGNDNIKHHISTVKQKDYFLNKIEALINNK